MWYVWAIGIGLFVWSVISNVRIAKLQRMLGRLESHIDEWEEKAAHMQADFTEQLATVQRESDLKLAKVREEWLNVRQRWTLTINQLVNAREWLRVLIAELKAHNIPVPLPKNIEEFQLHRNDESVHFDEIEKAAEHRLDDIVKEAVNANASIPNPSH